MADNNALARRLVPQIRAILSSSDLSTVSAKAVRKQLISKGEDEAAIKAARAAIDERISEIYDGLTAANNPPSPASSEEIALTGHQPSSQPEPLVRRVKSEPGSQTVKRERDVKPYAAAAARTVVVEDDEEEETDEQMARRLQLEFDGQASGSRPRRAGATTPKSKKKASRVKKRLSRPDAGSGSDGERATKRRAAPDNNFNKELILSDALAELVDAPRLSRPQTVKKIWEYIRENGLQDQSDKRYILCDDKLKRVFHTDRLHMFTMNKILVDHVRNPEDIIMKDEVKPDL